MRIYKTTDLFLIDEIHELDRKLFNDGSEFVENVKIAGERHYWYVKDGQNVIAFAIADYDGEIVIGQRSGVLKPYRGNGLQKRFIKRRHNLFSPSTHITYVHPQNPASLNSFISMAYKAYWPDYPWGGDGMVYLTKTV